MKHCLVSKHADQMSIEHDPTQSNKVSKRENVWSCLIAKHFPFGQNLTMFDQMSDVAQILLIAIKHHPARSNKVSKRENVWSLNNVWSPNIPVVVEQGARARNTAGNWFRLARDSIEVLSIMPNRPVRDQCEYPRKMDRLFAIKPCQSIGMALPISVIRAKSQFVKNWTWRRISVGIFRPK